ncbi:transglycosylase domain-containing protein [Streptomyces sp. ME19-01-6]|uniref:transglycosylase domain-containing protein n=1 Tax=Streptomyces sp. ME19-01-6 TaxID=3028686 RepID=UPI0029AB9BAB|nr:transglycosylase domain-containing protein [Streptomyces sp. ME19-01-6]MDX3226987.1 transglycosylase domain-containing protein [Streptomyces sp. ME19-01-6]
MSEHRRKPPQPQGGGRAAARRAAQQSSGRRAAQPHSATGSESAPHGEERPYGGRAEARRAAQRGGSRRRGADPDAGGAGHGGGRRAADGGRGGRGRGGGDGRPVKKRFIDYPRAGKDGFRHWVPSWKLVTGTFLFFFAMLVGAVGIGLWLVEVPTAQAASKVEKNVYYWADGKQMVVSGGGDFNRQIVPLSEIDESLQNAVISAENASFYDDAGVDPMGIARAVVNMAKGGETQSGSTITQQFVKNTYLDQSQTLTRKARELFISIKVGATMDKDDILAGYLNTAYYGRGAYGCQAAARAYYDKDCKDLDPSQSAFLAATLNGPNLYDPAGGYGANASKDANTKRAQARWEWILKREVEVGRMNKADSQELIDKGFPMPREPKIATNKEGQIGYLTDLADNYIVAHTHITKTKLDQGGYQIHTTFDRKKMNQLETAVKKVSKENINPKLRPEYDKYVQFGGASVEPKTGKIVAIYGGKNALEHFRNNADETGVQVGSTFKPFVLAAAMKDGVRDKSGPRDQPDSMRTPVSPKSVYDGDNKLKLRDYNGTIWHDKDGKEWHQRNDGDEDRGKITLRTAMQWSVNTPYIQLGMDVGTDKVRDAAIAAGLSQDQMASITPTFSLGTSAPSAIRLAGAYATFAASGKQADPYSVESVEDKKGEVYNHKDDYKLTTAFDANVADNVTDVLENVVEHGTGTSAQIGRPAAGKTGTTDENKSAWFSGYTPQLSTAIGMWRVNDKAKKQEFLSMRGVGTGRPNESIHGASYPAEIWADYMREAMKDKKVVNFPEPEPIGKKIFGDGASPTAPPSTTAPPKTPSKTPTPTPSGTPSTETPSTSPSPTDTCDPLDFECNNNGGGNGNGGNGNGGNGGNDSGGDTGGSTTTPTTEPPGGDNGGWFGGGG